jgi:hypothetical protein
MKEHKKCFVIMPFGQTTDLHTEEFWTNHFHHMLKPLIQDKTKILVERSKAIRSEIVQDIIKNLIFSQIVIADITDLNANVMWELGVRQSFSNRTILIAEEGTEIPFDISVNGILHYPLPLDPDFTRKSVSFQIDLLLAIQDCITNPHKADSHVLETISGRASVYEIIRKEDNLRRIDAFLMEFDYNTSKMKTIMRLIEDNKQDKDETTAAFRLKIEACNQLLTNRYLDEKPDFYELIHKYHTDIEIINSELNEWSTYYDVATRYFERYMPSMMKVTDDVMSAIQAARKNVENLL